MKAKNIFNEFELCHRFRPQTIMRLGTDGFFHECGKARGVLVKREHLGQVWYHLPEDYLEWKHHLQLKDEKQLT